MSIGFFLHSCSAPEEKSYEKTETASPGFSSIPEDHQSKIIVESPKGAVIEGGLFFMNVQSTAELTELSADVRGKTAKFYPVSSKDDVYRYQGMIGLEFGTPAGELQISVKACFKNPPLTDPSNEKDRSCETVVAKIEVKAGEFPSERLTVSPRSVDPSKKDLVRIKREQKILNKVHASSLTEKLWDAPIHLPVNSEITSVYGSNRKYNGKVAGVHYGTDFRAPTGTPIESALRGKVVLAQNLFFTGYTVILDHGYGFFTSYFHMSKLSVKEGMIIEKGKLLGLSGATGRASGPHLHWGVRVHGFKIDPMALVKLLSARDGK